MAIIILVLVLVAWIFGLVAYPEFRRWLAALGALAAVGIAAHFWLTRSESERAADRIAPTELVLDQLELDPTPRGATLTGRVRNASDFRLREMILDLRLYDCAAPEGPLDECPVIGEATAIARPDVPPGQIRALSAHFIFSDLPPVLGTLRWDWRITDIRATPE
jgi:hypothetical protein